MRLSVVPHPQEAAGQDRFSIFVAAPEPEEAYVSRTRRTQHYNRLVRRYGKGGPGVVCHGGGDIQCSKKRHKLPRGQSLAWLKLARFLVQ
jgi:hypothetical protein